MKRLGFVLLPLLLALPLLAGRGAVAQMGAEIKVSVDPSLGAILTDSEGKTLYLFTKDTTAGESSCYEQCAVNWPPVPATEGTALAAGIPGTLGVEVSSGDVRGDDLGIVDVRSASSGDITLRDVHGPISVGHVGSGDLRFDTVGSVSVGSVGSGDDLSEIPADFLFDPRVKDFGGIEMSASTYRTAILDAGQKVVDGSGRQQKDNRGTPAVDTIFDFVFPERSFADNDYVEQLISKDIITEHFAKDVLMVDFTRPVFSEDRCGLLSFAPQLSADDMTADKIRQGFIDSLKAESPAAKASSHC